MLLVPLLSGASLSNNSFSRGFTLLSSVVTRVHQEKKAKKVARNEKERGFRVKSVAHSGT